MKMTAPPSVANGTSPLPSKGAQRRRGRIEVPGSCSQNTSARYIRADMIQNGESTFEVHTVRSKPATSLGGRGVVRSDCPSSGSALHEVEAEEMPVFTGHLVQRGRLDEECSERLDDWQEVALRPDHNCRLWP